MQRSCGQDAGQTGAFNDTDGSFSPLGVRQHIGNEIKSKKVCDPVEHDRRDHFMHTSTEL